MWTAILPYPWHTTNSIFFITDLYPPFCNISASLQPGFNPEVVGIQLFFCSFFKNNLTAEYKECVLAVQQSYSEMHCMLFFSFFFHYWTLELHIKGEINVNTIFSSGYLPIWNNEGRELSFGQGYKCLFCCSVPVWVRGVVECVCARVRVCIRGVHAIWFCVSLPWVWNLPHKSFCLNANSHNF